MALQTFNDYVEAKLVHSIHTTERRSFKGCRRRWAWVFRDFYYPTVTAKPLEFGVAFHEAMERLYDPETWSDWDMAYALAKVAFAQKTREQLKAYEASQGPADAEVKKDYDERVELGFSMLHHYFKQVMPKYDTDYTPRFVEVKFEVPIFDPDTKKQLWCKCDNCFRRWKNSPQGIEHHDEWQNTFFRKLCESGTDRDYARKLCADSAYYREHHWDGLPVTYGGRVDCLMEDKYGYYWVFDWKTAARISGDENESGPWGGGDDHLLWDEQITSYVWALQVQLGLPIAGFVYVEIKKAKLEEPEPMKSRRLGRLYSTNKQNSYDADLYEKIVAENDTAAYEEGLYGDFITHLRENVTLHKRHQVHRNQTELDNAARYIYQEALDITDPHLRIYPSPGRFACTTCAFAQPCLAVNQGEDVEYLLDSMYDKRKYHYYEDAELSTDKTGRG